MDALFDAAMGLLLLSASWDGLFEALGLPVARPAFYAQLAGGLLLAYVLLWLVAAALAVFAVLELRLARPERA
jgi:hypothetical protein